MLGRHHDRLAEWFRELRMPLRRFLGSHRGVAHMDLDDVAQEVFLRLLRFDRADLITQPKSYLFRMAANVASEWGMLARHRRPHGSQWLSELSTEGELHDDLQRAERDAEIARAIGSLSPRTQAILRLHFDEGLTYEAIAERLQITRRVVKREILRAYAGLRDMLCDEHLCDSEPCDSARAGGRR